MNRDCIRGVIPIIYYISTNLCIGEASMKKLNQQKLQLANLLLYTII